MAVHAYPRLGDGTLSCCGQRSPDGVTTTVTVNPDEVTCQGRTPRPGDQPMPIPNDGPGMHDLLVAELRAGSYDVGLLVADDLEARAAVGVERYGTKLQAGNGRDPVRDLYEELLDAMAYARQAAVESAARGIRSPGLGTVEAGVKYIAAIVRGELMPRDLS